MSRIGKQPVAMPDGVSATLDGQQIKIKGSRGELTMVLHGDIEVIVDGQILTCQVKSGVGGRAAKQASAHWGTSRARLANMVQGVTDGFVKKLELHGVGYKAGLTGKNLELSVGYSHPVQIEAPEGISFNVDKEVITVEGNDAIVVGQVAADIRAVKKPEPYKGKGIRYQGERVRRKVGKVVGTTV